MEEAGSGEVQVGGASGFIWRCVTAPRLAGHVHINTDKTKR